MYLCDLISSFAVH